MNFTAEIKRSISGKQIWNIFKFELYLQKKRYLTMLILSLAFYNIFTIFIILAGISDPLIFVANAVGQQGSFLLLVTLFFAGGILADEFDKRTALTNFTKTGRNNFFIGKVLAVFMVVMVWIGPVFIETLLFTAILYGSVPIELFIWFGFYNLVGGMYVCLYLLHSAIFRSGSQAMTIGFVTFLSTTIAFGILGSLFGLWYFFPIYAEIAAQAIFTGPLYEESMIIDVNVGIIMILCYLIPSLILSYVLFKRRDV